LTKEKKKLQKYNTFLFKGPYGTEGVSLTKI